MRNILSIVLIIVFMSAWAVVDAQQPTKVTKMAS
jgi:hypothetical protein